MTRARAEELAAFAGVVARTPARAPVPLGRAPTFSSLPRDVKTLLVAGAVVLAGGLGWLVFGPSRPSAIPAVLGYVDQGPPPAPRPTPTPRPPLRLPWWK